GVRGQAEDSVLSLDQARARAVAGRERVQARTGALRGLQVGQDVRAPKPIDRLFRVTDQEQRRALTLAKYLAKYLILEGIGVLELVDERGLEATRKRALERRTCGSDER